MRIKIKNYDELLTKCKVKDFKKFPKSFGSLIDKLARSEHNRWNASNYLYGWQHDEIRNNEAKLHPCLLPIEEFDTDILKDTFKYDLLSILDVPKYLSYVGYQIIVLKE